MNERDRLIELIERHCLARIDVLKCTSEKDIECSGCLADHLIANNATIPPVNVGQTVYLIRYPLNRPAFIDECTVAHVSIDLYKHGGKSVMFDSYNFSAYDRDIGKTVFLTREEAEQALKERNKDNDNTRL